MLFDVTLCITLCGQINDLGHETKMMKLVFMSVLSTLFIYFFFIFLDCWGKNISIIKMKTTAALCRDQCLILLSTTQTEITISSQRDLQPKSIPLKGLLGFAFLLNKISAGDTVQVSFDWCYNVTAKNIFQVWLLLQAPYYFDCGGLITNSNMFATAQTASCFAHISLQAFCFQSLKSTSLLDIAVFSTTYISIGD